MVNGSQRSEQFNKRAAYFIDEEFNHYKPIGATHEGKQWLEINHFTGKPGVIMADDMKWFDKNLLR